MKKYIVTDQEIRSIIKKNEKFILSYKYIYGIPRGGVYVVDIIKEMYPQVNVVTYLSLTKPKDTLIVDDLIDSGKTIQPFIDKGFLFFVLFNKQISKDNSWYVFPWEEEKKETVEDNIVRILQYIGEDVKREGLQETPKRVVKSYEELFSGYKTDLNSIIKTFDSEGFDEMVVVKDIDYFSFCEHHMIPFWGKVHIGYIPNGKILGLSKFAKIVEAYARRLQVQERLTDQIATFIEEKLNPLGVMVVVEGTHMCMVMRGVKKLNAKTVTSSIRGVFKEDNNLVRSEFLSFIKN